MPLFWRYLLAHYLKVLILCTLAFVALLLTMRLDEIAQFAALGPSLWQVLWFALQQIPYILPIAIPISALISALLLVNGLSNSKELTALRAAGLSLTALFTPLLLTAFFLSLMNFYIISEVSTSTHLHAGLSKSQLRAINPLLLMSNKHIMKLKGFYFDVLGPSQVGEYVHDFIFFSPNRQTNRLNAMIAKKIAIDERQLVGEQVTLLTEQSIASHEEEKQLVLENIQKLQTGIDDFSRLMDKKTLFLNNDHLPFSQLLIREGELRSHFRHLRGQDVAKADLKEAREQLYAAWSEMVRRMSVGLAVFSFTLMGLAFGSHVSRRKKSGGVLALILLATACLVAFFTAKNFEQNFFAAAAFYLAPHVLIWTSSLYAMRRIYRGIE